MTERYVETGTILDRILERTVADLEARKAAIPFLEMGEDAERVNRTDPPRDFIAALRRDTVALIAEVKKASPSKGVFVEDFDPVALAQTYEANGAAAISVLTDQPFFQGSLDYLRAIRQAVGLPLLRKDFIIDPYQVAEARAAGADAVLLIVAALTDDQLAHLHAEVTEFGMAALVEVHDEAELARAVVVGATLIGVNNRDLRTFDVDLNTTGRIAASVPDNVTLVAESGIKNVADVAQMGLLGAHAVLVGESLVTAEDTAAKVRELAGVQQ